MAPTPLHCDCRHRHDPRRAEHGGDPDRVRALRVELAVALGTRFVRHGGANADRVQAEELAGQVLADPAATRSSAARSACCCPP